MINFDKPSFVQLDASAVRQQFGLDRPLASQYVSFMSSLLRGDFGQSFYYRTPVFELYLSRLPNSLMLAAAAMAFSLLIGKFSRIDSLNVRLIAFLSAWLSPARKFDDKRRIWM